MIDKYTSNLEYLTLSLTNKCNLDCVCCSTENMCEDYTENIKQLNFEDYKFVIQNMSILGMKKIKFVGGEPLLYPRLCELIRFAKEECNIEFVKIVTNGTELYQMTRDLKMNGVDEIEIILNSLKEFKYKHLTGQARLKDVIRSIESCIINKIKVSIRCTLINDFNEEEMLDFMYLTNVYDIDIQFMELLPRGNAKHIYSKGYISTSSALNFDLNLYDTTEQDDIFRYYKLENAKGRIGIINNDIYCSQCSDIKITSTGSVVLCPNSDKNIDIYEYLGRPLMFKEVMKETINKKQEICII